MLVIVLVILFVAFRASFYKTSPTVGISRAVERDGR